MLSQQDRDTMDARALVTGTIIGQMLQYSANPDRAVLIDNVEMVDDDQGNHLPMVRLTMRSGVKLLLIVAEDV